MWGEEGGQDLFCQGRLLHTDHQMAGLVQLRVGVVAQDTLSALAERVADRLLVLLPGPKTAVLGC